MSMWPGAVLRSMLTVAVGGRASISSGVLVSSPLFGGFPKNPLLTSLYLVGVSAVIQLCGSPVSVVVMAKGTHCNPVIRSLSFCGPLSLGCDVHKYFSAFSLP